MAASYSSAKVNKGRGILRDDLDEEVVLLDDPVVVVIDPHHYLLARVLGSKHLNPRTFTNVIRGLWSPTKGLEIAHLESSLFLLQFKAKRDLTSILKGEPWSFDKRLIVLKQVSGDDNFRNVEMQDCPFWVQLYDVPMSFRTDRHLPLIARRLGHFSGYDERGPWLGQIYQDSGGAGYLYAFETGDLWSKYSISGFGFSYSDEDQDYPYGEYLRASPGKVFITQINHDITSASTPPSLLSEPRPHLPRSSGSFSPVDSAASPHLIPSLSLNLDSLLGACHHLILTRLQPPPLYQTSSPVLPPLLLRTLHQTLSPTLALHHLSFPFLVTPPFPYH
ncbi:hypothetical protein Tsubulata_005303 [Turnera subulata]|uniref:DUF4283 domain-containing protein n=1 Tax=Turnera subulata TaxID=218843 RepID=A0A9Q0FK60_9ROSI|nr:hypothetical protein Tsubulata_005303 [Turnera subulata]